MRILKLQVQMTIDGFIAGPNAEMDWMILDWSEDLKEYIKQLTNPVSTILLGRNLAEGFIPYWTAAFNKPEPEEGAEKLVTTPKVVFSKSLVKSDPMVIGWDNTTLANGELADEVNALKNGEGGDMIVYGGSKFVSSLIKENLIDELHLLINPTIIGKGLPIFQAVTQNQQYQLVSSQSFDCGIVVMKYKPV